MSLEVNDAVLGRGMLVGFRLTLGTGTFLNIGTLVSVDGPGTTVGEVETPLMVATTKQYLPILPETECTLNIRGNNTNPANIALRNAVKVAPVPIVDWQVTYPDGYIDTFSGFPKGYNITGGENETPLMAAIPIRATTVVTTTAPVGP